MDHSYHNTANETTRLNEFEVKAQKQDNEILAYFQSTPGIHYTPPEVHFIFPNAPLTSIRRAITNLTRKGLLVKSERKKQGSYGRNNHTWYFPAGQLKLL